MGLLADAEPVAVDACLEAGQYLRRVFQDGSSDADHSAVDVKSSADVGAERRMLDGIQDAFPGHTIDAEESGHHPGDERCRWIVDPLDGTNNFEAGLPSFAAAVTLLVDETPVLAAAYVPITDELYVCRRDTGLRYGSTPVAEPETPAPPPEAATVMSVIGHDVKRDRHARAVSAAIDRGVEAVCKRRLESWSPTVHWGLLARGRLDGAVCYRPDAEEQRLGELFVDAVGHETARGSDDEWFVAARTDELQAELVTVVENALDETDALDR